MRILKSKVLEEGLQCIVSKRFYKILLKMKHPIATEIRDLVEYGGNDEVKFKLSFIDATNDIDKISFATSSKIADMYTRTNVDTGEEYIIANFVSISEATSSYWLRNRSEMKIGKLVKKMFGDKYKANGDLGNDIESFVNEYKSIYSMTDMSLLFDVVEGDKVVELYNHKSYEYGHNDSILGNSCMNDLDKAIEFYALNSHVVKLLVLYADNTKTKIIGRALIWKLSTFNGEDTTRYFMDRIYTSHNYQDAFFMRYAKEHGYYRKTYQSYDDFEVYDPTLEEDNDLGEITMTIEGLKPCKYHPFLDTFMYLNPDTCVLSNFSSCYDITIKLDETNGSTDNGRWVEYYGKMFNKQHPGLVACYVTDDKEDNTIFRLKKDATWLPYYKAYCPTDYIKNESIKLINTTCGVNEMVLKDDAIWLTNYKEYTTVNHARNMMVWVEEYSDYFEKKDCVYDEVECKYIVLCK